MWSQIGISKLKTSQYLTRQNPLPINHHEVSRIIETTIRDREQQKCYWFITETAEGEAVGMTGLESVNTLHGHTILPVFVGDPWRRSGVGIRMVCLMMDLAFLQLRLHRVATVYRSDNIATEKLVHRLGFKAEGISRQAWFANGEYYDLVNVGVIVDEWLLRRVKLRAELDASVVIELGPRPSGDWSWPKPLD